MALRCYSFARTGEDAAYLAFDIPLEQVEQGLAALKTLGVGGAATAICVQAALDGAAEIARRSRGTPRIANALLRRVRDFAMVKGEGHIDLGITRIGLSALNIDSRGLDQMDNKILGTIIEKFGGGPVGLNTIATAVGEDAGTIEEVYEPFLIKEGFLKRTPRGREATELAYRHLGVTPPGKPETLLF